MLDQDLWKDARYVLLDSSAVDSSMSAQLATLDESKMKLVLAGDLARMQDVMQFSSLLFVSSTQLDSWQEAASWSSIKDKVKTLLSYNELDGYERTIVCYTEGDSSSEMPHNGAIVCSKVNGEATFTEFTSSAADAEDSHGLLAEYLVSQL